MGRSKRAPYAPLEANRTTHPSYFQIGSRLSSMARSQRPRSYRRDAEANRQRILDAAAEVFCSEGVGASLAEIARRAGVGNQAQICDQV